MTEDERNMADAIASYRRAHALGEDGWDAARDRITETNQAIRGERERCARLADDEAATLAAAEGTGHRALARFAALLREEGT